MHSASAKSLHFDVSGLRKRQPVEFANGGAQYARAAMRNNPFAPAPEQSHFA